MKVLNDLKISSATVDLIPFTESEFQKFIKKYTNASSEEIDYKRLTNYNPLLLTLIKIEKKEKAAITIVNNYFLLTSCYHWKRLNLNGSRKV